MQFHGLRAVALADLDLVRSSTQRRGEPALANKRSTFPERIFLAIFRGQERAAVLDRGFLG